MVQRLMRVVLGAAALAWLAIILVAPTAAQTPVPAVPSGARQKVIFHVGDADAARWTVAFNNVFNVRKDLGPANVDIEVVAINAGINMLRLDSVEGSRIAQAIKDGVKVIACENSMRGQKVVRDDLLPGIDYVPAGVVELMQRQREGYAYIRP
jgi:intracellular sulfur oxidation DsrE/DsrF family protein